MEAFRISIDLHPSDIFISDEAKSLQGYSLVFSFLSVENKQNLSIRKDEYVT